MRILKFIVNGQIITKDPNCDFDGLIPGSNGYLKAEFSFSPEWKNYAKVASFWSVMGKEYTPKKITDDRNCIIPAEALQKRTFKIQVVGMDINGNKIKTNKVAVSQNGKTEVNYNESSR